MINFSLELLIAIGVKLSYRCVENNFQFQGGLQTGNNLPLFIVTDARRVLASQKLRYYLLRIAHPFPIEPQPVFWAGLFSNICLCHKSPRERNQVLLTEFKVQSTSKVKINSRSPSKNEHKRAFLSFCRKLKHTPRRGKLLMKANLS